MYIVLSNHTIDCNQQLNFVPKFPKSRAKKNFSENF